jgi:choline dehydrogenase-like flavoprotein
MLSPLIDPWLLYWFGMIQLSAGKFLRFLRYRRIMGIMVKVKDDRGGELYPDGSFSKPLTVSDRRKLDTGAGISEEILMKAGCSRRSLVTSLIRGAHPGGACPIGPVLNENLETHQIKNLYVSDASVFPEALGTPVVATVAAMNKRLARHILARLDRDATETVKVAARPERVGADL